MMIIAGGRASGKTYRALMRSSVSGAPIIVRTRREAYELKRYADALEIKIRHPLSLDEQLENALFSTVADKKVIVEYPFELLEQVLGAKIIMSTLDVQVDSPNITWLKGKYWEE